jgi:two-component system LytT family sensor kinase
MNPTNKTLGSPSETGVMRRMTGILGNRDRQFWFLQFFGWSAYFAATYVGAITYEKPASYINIIAVASISGFILATPLRYLYRRLWSRSPAAILTTTLLSSYVLGLAWAVIKSLTYWKVFKPEYLPDSIFSYLHGTVAGTYVFLCWSGLYFGIKYYKTLQAQIQKTLRANSMAHEAKLKMLRYQLNPHFLFNTLNAISTLILDKENASANMAVTRLSDFLRHTLHSDPMQKISLDQELDSLNLYLEIEKVRFQERLKVEFDVDDKARSAQVPSLITQPIIENAIKYAVAHREEGGCIRISAHVIRQRLIIELSDDGPGLNGDGGGRKASGTGGVGLRNTRERLHQLYGDQCSFELARSRPSGLRVIIGLPYAI